MLYKKIKKIFKTHFNNQYSVNVFIFKDDEELVDILRNLSKASSEKLSSTENSAKDKEIGARLEVHTDSNGSMWQFEGEESDNSDGQNIADGVVNDTSTAQSAIEAGISFCELSQRLQGVKVDSNGSQDQILDPQENVHSFLSSSEIVGILQSQMEYEEGLDEATFEKKSRKDGQPQKNTKNNFACTSHTFKECKEENTHIHSCKFADSKQMNKLNLPKTFYNFGKVRYNKRYRWSLFASEEENEFHRSRSRQKVYEMPLHEQIKVYIHFSIIIIIIKRKTLFHVSYMYIDVKFNVLLLIIVIIAPRLQTNKLFLSFSFL